MRQAIKDKFDSYPKAAKQCLMAIRALIFAVGEDWNAKSPDNVSLYFHCQTTLVDTFRELYKDSLTCVGNREIVVPLSAPIPVEQLSVCISLALRYHRIKQLPLLGR